MTIQKKSMRKIVDYPFCRQPWHIGAMLLGICYVFTMVWAFHLLHDDLEESLDFLRFGKKSSDSREQGQSGAHVVTAALNTAVAALPPGQVPSEIRVRAALVNVAGLRAASGGGAGPVCQHGLRGVGDGQRVCGDGGSCGFRADGDSGTGADPFWSPPVYGAGGQDGSQP
ncbi:MAG: hypothetical protein H7836_03240 [Magnetococcus sp. YQC-3]